MENIKAKKLVHYSSLERRSMYNSICAEDRTRGFSLVGSPDYIAPEMLTNEGYDLLVDYWSIGCIFFELLAAYPPFTSPTVDEIWVNVYHWKEVLERPTYSGEDSEFNMSDDAWDLIERLIADKSVRLHSPAQIKMHRWFKDADWSNIREMEPPFVPSLSSEIDTHYFDDFNDPEALAKYDLPTVDDTKDEQTTPGNTQGRGLWVGWTYRNQDNRHGHVEQSLLRKQHKPISVKESA
eukprot:Ihof_evm5s63 gene=Ihof_evmTU5s63